MSKNISYFVQLCIYIILNVFNDAETQDSLVV